MDVMPGAGMVHLRSHYTVPETLRRLESALRAHGLNIFARIDHADFGIGFTDFTVSPLVCSLIDH